MNRLAPLRYAPPLAVFAALGAALLPSIAGAQASSGNVTSIRFELDARYDSNIARSSEARAAARGLDRKDVRFSPAVTLNLARSFGRSRATLAGVIGYDFHTRNDQLNSERIALNGGLTVQAGPCQLESNVGFSRRQSDLADLAFIANAPLATVENTETTQRYGAELGCGGQYGLRPFGGIEYERGDNSTAIRERADFDATRYLVGVQYVSPTLGEIGIFASRRDVDLRGPRLPGDPGTYRQTNYGIRFERALGTRLQIAAEIAHSEVSSRGVGGGFSGLTWNLRTTALVGTRLRVTAALGREITNSLSSDATFVIKTPYGLRAMYALNERLQVDAGAQITRQRYRYSVAPAAIFLQRDRREIYDAGVNYKFARRLNVRVSAGQERRRANDAFFNYKSTFAIAGLGFEL